MRRKYHIENVDCLETLSSFKGWIVGGVHKGENAGITLYNSQGGDRVRLLVSPECFENGRLKLSKRANTACKIESQKRG